MSLALLRVSVGAGGIPVACCIGKAMLLVLKFLLVSVVTYTPGRVSSHLVGRQFIRLDLDIKLSYKTFVKCHVILIQSLKKI